MAYGTLDNIETEGWLRSEVDRPFDTRRRMVPHRTDRFALFADGDCCIRHAVHGIGFSAAKLVDRPKRD
jgi:hypothetical protein